MNEKILVNDNTIQVNAIVDQAKETAKVINSRLIPGLEEIGQLISDAVLKDCLSGASQTRKNYFEAVASDIKATRTPGIKKQMEEAASEAFEKFERELSIVRKEARNYKHLTIVDEVCTLTPENLEKLSDTCRTYLTDPKEIAAYKLHVEIIEKLNQLFNGNTPYRWTGIFQEDGKGNICRNDQTDYSKLV